MRFVSPSPAFMPPFLSWAYTFPPFSLFLSSFVIHTQLCPLHKPSVILTSTLQHFLSYCKVKLSMACWNKNTLGPEVFFFFSSFFNEAQIRQPNTVGVQQLFQERKISMMATSHVQFFFKYRSVFWGSPKVKIYLSASNTRIWLYRQEQTEWNSRQTEVVQIYTLSAGLCRHNDSHAATWHQID